MEGGFFRLLFFLLFSGNSCGRSTVMEGDSHARGIP